MTRRTYTAEQRAEALALYETDGPTQAAEQTGIPKQTIASWARAAGVHTVRNERTAAAVEAVKLDWELRRELMVHEIGAASHMALAQTVNALGDGMVRDAKDAALTMAILVDKAQLLSGSPTGRIATQEERDHALNEAKERSLSLVASN